MSATNQEVAEYLEGGIDKFTSGEVTWCIGGLGLTTPALRSGTFTASRTACAYGACNYAQTGSQYQSNLLEQDGFTPQAYPYVEELRPYLNGDTLYGLNDTAESVDVVLDAMTAIVKELRNSTEVV